MNQYKIKLGQWQTAVGLQAVDGLQPSDYLYSVAGQHIKGQIDINHVHDLLNAYYQNKESHKEKTGTDEADKVAVAIVQVLADGHFSLCADEYRSIHESLFYAVFSHAGMYRLRNIAKKEWVLKQDSVEYGDYRAIEYDLEKIMRKEQNMNYSKMNDADKIRHFADFIAELWQIHPFFEGNTRTTAVFAVKYLNELGYQVNNEVFRNHSFFFRNALVRACYQDRQKGIEKDKSFLYKFFENLILKAEHPLYNRDMLVSPPEGWNLNNKSDENVDRARISHIGIYKHKNEIYSIKCHIDGMEQISKHLKIKDLMDYFKIKENKSEKDVDDFLFNLACEYFKDNLEVCNKKNIQNKR